MHRRLFARPCALRCAVTDHQRSVTMVSTRRASRRVAIAILVALSVLVMPATAAAQDEVITIEFDDVLFAPAGSLVPVGSVAVGAALQGRTCLTSVITANQSSIHPENDLLIATGGSTARVEDVEDFTNGTNSWLVDVTLGASIDMSVEMGPDGISSLGFTVEIDCSRPLSGSTVPILASGVTTTTTSTTITTQTTDSTAVTSSPEAETTTTVTSSPETTTTVTSSPETTTTGPDTTISETTSGVTVATSTTAPASSSTQLQVQETTTLATTVSSTAAPTVTIPTTTTTQPVESTSTTVSQNRLEQSPPASAVPAQPSYTG